MRAIRQAIAGLAVFMACGGATAEDRILSFDPDLAQVINPVAEIRVLATGYRWIEGPAWDASRGRLYFSDVPENKAYAWSEQDGVQTFLDPSGGEGLSADDFREPGSNGLLMAPDGNLLIANHGTRAVEQYDFKTGARKTLAHTYGGKSLNSPNDLIQAADGTLYFTDPPYGLAGIDASPLKEQPHNGVYALGPNGKLTLIDGALTFPNGVALSPDGETLYVTVSDPDAPRVYRYSKKDGRFTGRTLFFDAAEYREKGWDGLPDGLAVAKTGHLFITGPGGVFILAPDGRLLGLIRLERATGNCTFGGDGKTLFITSKDRLLAVDTRVVGLGQHD
jgi:gluconolactonase